MTPQGLAQLKQDEGLRLRVYDDKTGETLMHCPSGGNPTVGYGRNLVGRGLTKEEADVLLANDITATEGRVLTEAPWLQPLNPVLQDVVFMVDFNTGDVWKFPKFLAALRAGNREVAAQELLNSEAAREGPARYARMADAVRSTEWGT